MRARNLLVAAVLLGTATWIRPIRRMRQMAIAIRILSERREKKSRTSRTPSTRGAAKPSKPIEGLATPVKISLCIKNTHARDSKVFVPYCVTIAPSQVAGATLSIPKQVTYSPIFTLINPRILSEPTIDTFVHDQGQQEKVTCRDLVPLCCVGSPLRKEHDKISPQKTISGKLLPRIYPEWNKPYSSIPNTSCYVEDVSEEAMENDNFYDDYEDEYEEFDDVWSPDAVRKSNRLPYVLYRLGMLEKYMHVFKHPDSDECTEECSDPYTEEETEDDENPFTSFYSYLQQTFPNINNGMERCPNTSTIVEEIEEDSFCNVPMEEDDASDDGLMSGFSESQFSDNDRLKDILNRMRCLQEQASIFSQQYCARLDSDGEESIFSEEDVLEYSDDEESQVSCEYCSEKDIETEESCTCEDNDDAVEKCSPQKGRKAASTYTFDESSSKPIPTAQSPTKPSMNKSSCLHRRVGSLMRSESLDSAESIGPKPDLGGHVSTVENDILPGLGWGIASEPKFHISEVSKMSLVNDQAQGTSRAAGRKPASKQRVYTWEEKGKAIADDTVESCEMTDEEKAILAYIHRKDAERYPDDPPCCSKAVSLKKKERPLRSGYDDFPAYEFVPTGFNKFGEVEGDLMLSQEEMEEQMRLWDELAATQEDPSKYAEKPEKEYDLEGILSREEIEFQKRAYEEISSASAPMAQGYPTVSR